MALTRPNFTQFTTTITSFADPVTVLNQGSTSANVDVGFLFNRANGLVSNVALYWSESAQTFITALTANAGTTNTNIAVISFANVRTGNITANGFFFSNGATYSTGSAFSGGYVPNQSTFGANLVANSGTASSSNVTGAVVVTGGIGVSGSVNIGSNLVFSNGTNPGISKPLGVRVDINNAGGLDANGSFWSGYHFNTPDGIVVNGLTGYPRMALYWNYNSATNPNNINFNMVAGNNATGGNANVTLGTDTAGYVRFLTNDTERLKIGGEGNVVATATTTSTSTTTGALVVAGGVGIAGNIVTAGTANKFTGCVAIGSMNPTLKFQISADGYNTRISDSTNGYGYNIGRSTTDGLLYFYGDQTVYTGYVFSGVDGERVKISSAGNLVINATETSSTTTSGALVVKGGVGVAGTMTVGGTITGKTNTGGNVAASNDSGTLSIRGSTTNAAVISFHRPSLYAINMGLDTDNTFKIGGWSDGASTYRLQVTSAGALTLTGGITATGATLTGTIIASTVNAGTIGNSGATLTGTVSTAAQNSITTMTGLTGFGTASVVTTAAGHLTVTGNLTVNGTQNIINNTIYETTEYVVTQNATFGNVSNSLYAGSLNTANAVITGGYVNGLANLTATTAQATNFSSGNIYATSATAGTWGTANAALYISTTALTTNQTFYPQFANLATTGNTITGVSANWIFNPSTGNMVLAGTTTSTSTTTGALVIAGGVGVAGQGVFGGNLTVGNMNQTRANLLVFGGNLNAGVGSSIALAEFYATNSNGSYLRILNNRHAQGADWTSANTRIQQRIDVTDQGYIEFNPVGATYGVAIGSGTTEIMRLASSGNVVINATTASTSTTTGALVVKGGAGIAGNITTSGQLTLTNASDYNLYASGAGDNFMQGALGIGALPAASTVTLVGSNPATGAITVNNILLNSDIQSDVTSTYNSYNSNPSTAAAAFTVNNLRHFSAGQRAFGANSTVTNQVGFYALSSLTGATNNFGFRSDIASGTGRFNFYAGGTANNYFAGNVGIGTTTPGFPLTVSGAASVSGNLSVGEASVSGNLYVGGSFFQGTLPSVLNDISSQFDSVTSVFPLKLDQTSISSITNSADVEVVINGRRLVPYVTEQRFPWLTPYDSYRGYRVSSGNLIIYNAPDIGDQAMVTIVSTSAAVQTRRYPYSATTIAFGD